MDNHCRIGKIVTKDGGASVVALRQPDVSRGTIDLGWGVITVVLRDDRDEMTREVASYMLDCAKHKLMMDKEPFK